MKKILLTFAFILACLNMNAQKKTIDLSIKSGTIKPHSPITGDYFTVLSAEYDAEELSVTVSGYVGEVEIIVINPLYTIMDSEDLQVVGSTSKEIDLTSYLSSTYYLYIRLDNGDIYEGEFEIEE